MYDKLINSTQLDADLTTVADAIRTKGGTTERLSFPAGFANAISAIQTGSSGSEEEIPDDGNLHIFVNLYEGRLNPALSLAVKGTISIDWGDGSTETATGDSTTTLIVVPHEYSSEGKYHIIVAKVGNTTCNIMAESSRCALIRHPTLSPSSFERYATTISKVVIGNGFVTSINGNAFRNCYSLQNVTIPNSVASIGNYAFYSCYSLQNVTISNNVVSIGIYAFCSCYSLQNIIIPNSVASINSSAFRSCCSLQNIAIPDSVTNIGDYAFNGCTSMGKIRFESATPPTVAALSTFNDLPTDCIIEIPRGSLDAYRVATNYPNPNTYVYREV